ncbi:hypothetical protein BDY17DRAFT_326291 [Neohortaea acidophila]|uniref:Uncharacterized protein n=1 Tax=Neohortaea acidophila TaxID=245834 RepID=A0A6A6PLN6_9PEZI|nr:uncharacterized protein BDY17DRAFT_326291 [Neohortaea acidophila]KAF2480383.1 hypothetical protein BDY17DRAFT_326291 [Neohortaea acidophila]
MSEGSGNTRCKGQSLEIENRRQLDLGLVSGLQEARKLRKNRSVVEEGVVEAGCVNETSAGQELEKELIKQRELFAKRLKEAQEEMDGAIVENDRRASKEATAQQWRFEQKLGEIVQGSEDLKVFHAEAAGTNGPGATACATQPGTRKAAEPRRSQEGIGAD